MGYEAQRRVIATVTYFRSCLLGCDWEEDIWSIAYPKIQINFLWCFLACGEKFPSDVYFVFDAPYLGSQGSEKCSQFIETVLEQEELEEGMQVSAC